MADKPDVPINFIDNPHAPEILSTGHVGLWRHADNVHITLAAGRVDHRTSPGPINNVVIARLVMPVGAVQGLVDHLTQMFKNPEAPPPEAPKGQLH